MLDLWQKHKPQFRSLRHIQDLQYLPACWAESSQSRKDIHISWNKKNILKGKPKYAVLISFNEYNSYRLALCVLRRALLPPLSFAPVMLKLLTGISSLEGDRKRTA